MPRHGGGGGVVCTDHTIPLEGCSRIWVIPSSPPCFDFTLENIPFTFTGNKCFLRAPIDNWMATFNVLNSVRCSSTAPLTSQTSWKVISSGRSRTAQDPARRVWADKNQLEGPWDHCTILSGALLLKQTSQRIMPGHVCVLSFKKAASMLSHELTSVAMSDSLRLVVLLVRFYYIFPLTQFHEKL